MRVVHSLKDNTISIIVFERFFSFNVDEEIKGQDPDDYWVIFTLEEYFNIRINIYKYDTKYTASIYPDVFNGEYFTTYFNLWETVNIETI